MKKNERMVVRACGVSDIGRRSNNEDAFLIDEDSGLFIVADGMGGHDKGEVASWFTSEGLDAIVRNMSQPCGHGTLDHDLPIAAADVDVDSLIGYAVMKINKQLYDLNEQEAEKARTSAGDSIDARVEAERIALKHMGTTLVSLLVRGSKAYVAHIGDSRAYRLTGDTITQLTHDHSWVEEQVRAGALTPEEAKTHKKRNVITRSVGFRPEVEADIDVLSIEPPERFLLCSDGLSNVVGEKDLQWLGSKDDLDAACKELVATAVARGGRDNITAVLVDIRTVPMTPPEEVRDFTDL